MESDGVMDTVVMVLLVTITLLLIMLTFLNILGCDPLKYRRKRRSDIHTYETIAETEDEFSNRITQTLKIRVCSSDSVLMEQDLLLRVHVEAIPARRDTNSKTVRHSGSSVALQLSELPHRRYSVNPEQHKPTLPPKLPRNPSFPITPDNERHNFPGPSQEPPIRSRAAVLSDSEDTADTVGYLTPSTLMKKNSIEKSNCSRE